MTFLLLLFGFIILIFFVMKTPKKRWMVIILVLSLIYLIGNSVSIYRNIELLFQHLPEEYINYSNLYSLDDAFSNSTLETDKFKSIYNEQVVWVNDSLIAITVHTKDSLTDKTNVSWYKINLKGELMDSITFRNEYVDNIDSYLINQDKNYYSTWLMDGDVTQKPFRLIEGGKLLEKEEADVYLKDAVYSNSDYFYENRNDFENEKRFKKHVVYKHNEWFQFYTKDDLQLTVNRYYSNSDLEFKDIGELVYFYKKDWYGDHFPDFTLYINGKDPDHWTGTSFLNLKIKDEILKIQHYSKKYVDDSARKMPLDVYEGLNQNFYILKMEIDNGHTFYLIK